MSEIRSWAAGTLAAATVALGVGAGLQIARLDETVVPPVAPVVAVVSTPAPAPTARATPLPPAVTSTPTSARPTTTTRAPRTSRTAVYRCAPEEDARFDDPANPDVITNHDCPEIETSRSRAQQEEADEGPVIFGQTDAEAYRQCVRSPNSPGAAECRRITDAGGRGE
ncbi:hypothetical protein [Actinomycetospora aeridis]|uniref:Subtilisin inhibitor-like n=1 Tax=Actinomycetospora aeridis TaxID=3129231 RepID=A0ABU8N929_9PSEU